jgi:hypothetical protein
MQSGGVAVGFFETRVLLTILDYYKPIKDDTMLRKFRICLATPLYLAASLLLLISLRFYPPDIRKDARDSFL